MFLIWFSEKISQLLARTDNPNIHDEEIDRSLREAGFPGLSDYDIIPKTATKCAAAASMTKICHTS